MKKVKRKPGRIPLIKIEKYPIHNTSKTIVVPSKVRFPKVHPPPKEITKPREEVPVPTYVPKKDEAITTNGGQKQNPFGRSKSHRSTFYRPSNEDFGQLADMALLPDGYDQNLLQKRNGLKPDTKQPEQKNACEGPLVQTRSAFAEPASWLKLDENEMTNRMDEAQWQNIDSISDANLFLLSRSPSAEKTVMPKGCRLQAQWQTIDSISDANLFLLSRSPSAEKTVTPKEVSDETCYQLVRNNIRISNTPHVKRIADKFVKFKRNNIEIRKLEERVVCLEYDIFNLDAADPRAPTQKMRAFFSVKTKDFEGNNEENIPFVPSDVKRNFDIDDGDLQNMSKKEIEIIDDQIPENRSLLEDLKLVLRRKGALEKKKRQPTLDLICLYEMAIRESVPLNHDYSNTNLLSKAELQEIKDLILKKCASSVYGINRKTMKCQENTANDAECVLSSSLICELMREAKKV